MKLNFDGMLPIRGEVVVIEDEPTLCELVRDILEDVGAHCVSFASADDALVYLLQSHAVCTLIIADHGVPGQIQGLELAQMVASKWPDIPTIITSGWTAEHIGCPPDIVFLQKPWSLEQLVMTVSGVLQPGMPVTRRGG